MTISQYISDLLKKYKKIEIDTNHVRDGSDQYGLFKAPSRNITNYTDGSYEITEYYEFLARQNAGSIEERKEADEWLEDLAYWADDLGVIYELPPLDNNRYVTGFAITGSPYPMESDSRESLYQILLSITYVREREDV